MVEWLTNNGKVFKDIDSASYIANKENYKKILYLLTEYGRFKVIVEKEKVVDEYRPSKSYTNYFLEKISEVDIQGNPIITINIWKRS
jgi:hypothetical protein